MHQPLHCQKLRVRIDTFRDAIIPWSHSEGTSTQCQVLTMFIMFSRQWLAFRRQVVKVEIAPSATELKQVALSGILASLSPQAKSLPFGAKNSMKDLGITKTPMGTPQIQVETTTWGIPIW